MSSIVHDRDSYGFIRDTALSVMIKSLNTLHILSNVQVIDDKVRESVRLQAELHDKEKKVLRQQRKRCQKVSKELENLKMNHEKHSGAAGHRSSKPKKPSATSAATMASQYSEQDLQSSIYRRFQETQNHLDQLRIQDDFSTASDCTVTPSGCGTESYATTGAIPRGHRQDLANPPPVPPHQTQVNSS